uniref:Uncharacterized protein n=1 Tax=Roseihalotalea indica TaxID=2867963 RepID=A0AA49JIY1_9BACT|nr:hypothetical protein K4G66_01775 [Tunicatimonas sp. TK19036]
MSTSPLLLRILFATSLMVICFVVGGTLGSLSVSRTDGLAGAAVVLWYSVIGAVIGLIGGLIIPRYLSGRSLKSGSLFLGLITVILIGVLLYQYNHPSTAPEELPPETAPEQFPTESEDAISYSADTIVAQQRATSLTYEPVPGRFR